MLGFAFDDMTIDDRGYLYFTGTAMEEGVWSDMHGYTAFWPRDVIHAGMDGFKDKAITCQHEAVVGKILDIYKTELGFKAKGVITSNSVRALITNNILKGLSVTTEAYVDPVRKIVTRLMNQTDIAVVTNPACRVCMLENTWIDNMTNTEDSVIVDVAASAPEITNVDETEVVTAELSATETEDIVIENDNDEMKALNMRLSAYEAQIEAYKTTINGQEIMIAELSAEVSVVRARNEELAGKQRDELIGAIMSADPHADKTILEKTSNDALGAYLQTVMRLSKPKVVVTAPIGLKMGEAPKISNETKPVAIKDVDVTTSFIQYLKNKQ